MGGQHLEGDWAALELPLRIPQERVVLRHKVKKERKKDSADKSFSCSANMDAAKRAGAVWGADALFNRTHPLCAAAHRLFLSVVPTRLSGCDSRHT